MPQEPRDPAIALQRMLEAFWKVAHEACAEVEAWQPDLVVALYHGGQAPLRAALALWQETRATSFPPVLHTNLGREKLYRYCELRDTLGIANFIEWFCGPSLAGHCMAWVDAQTAWHAELRAQVAAVLGPGRAPARFLVVDDCLFEGTTWVLTLGLFQSVFPAAQGHCLMDLPQTWHEVLAENWLARNHPGVLEQLRTCAQAEHQQGIYWGCYGHFKDVAKGTEDVNTESLAWRPLTAASETVQALERFLPADEWLALPRWVYATIEETMRDWVRAGRPAPPAESRDPETLRQYYRPYMTPAHLVMRYVWLHRRITRRQVAASCGISPSQAGRLLHQLVAKKDLVRQGRGRGTTYDIAPNVGILTYGPLLTDLGAEIGPLIERRVALTTPFAVEYAHSDSQRAGAPTLMPVPAPHGAPVPAQLLVLRPDLQDSAAVNMLYRRAVERVGDDYAFYDPRESNQDANLVFIRELYNLAGVPDVLYVEPRPNIAEILREDLPAEAKAEILAQLAVASVTAETFPAGRDGIRYLDEAIRAGLATPLTVPYRQALLRLAGDAAGLEEARQRVVWHRGLG